MVSEVIETPEVEEAPAEQAVEETPIELGESPAEQAEEAEPDESVIAEEPDLHTELAALRAELAEVKAAQAQKPQRSEAEVRAEIEANLRAQQQAQEEQRQQEQAWKDELNESLQAVLVTKGYTEVSAEDVRSVGERFINKRYDQIQNRTVTEVTDALTWVKEAAMEQPHTKNLSPKAQRYASDLLDSFNAIYGVLKTRAEEGARSGYIPESELPAKVEAEIAKRNAKSREGQEELKRPAAQQPAGNTNSLEYWDTRVAHEGEDGYPVLTAQDWATYRQIRRQNGL